MLRFHTAGESHGRCLVAIVEGLPAGMKVDFDFIDRELKRRQLGYGRGGRMKIEDDHAEVLAGVRHGYTIGSPIALLIENKDWANWREAMSVAPVDEAVNKRSLVRPRPGHADLAGALKYNQRDIRNILERASARETAARVAVGALLKLFLKNFGLEVASHVLAIGRVSVSEEYLDLPLSRVLALADSAELRCADPQAELAMKAEIDEAKASGDSVGGVFEVIAGGVPPGLGSHIHWDTKIDGLLAQAIMSIPAVKAVELGCGVRAARQRGSEVHDEIFYDREARRFTRRTNNAGGLEGGITNGMEVRVRGYVKPLSTLRRPLQSVDIESKEPSPAAFERSDVCMVPAAGVVGEAMVAITLGRAFLEKFGGDSMQETARNFENYKAMLADF